MRDMMKAHLIGDPGNRPGGLQQQPFGLFDTVILEIRNGGHPVDLEHRFSQIVRMIVHCLLQHGIRDITGVILTDE